MAYLSSCGYIFVLLVLAVPSEATISCTFDTGLCGWHSTSGSTSGFQWTNTSGQTNDRTSGPLNDHTCENYNGLYLYAMGSMSDPSERAVLDSEEINVVNSSHLTFWYSMHGEFIGSLTLMEISQPGNTSSKLWSKSGQQGKGWTLAKVTVGPGLKYFRFEATAGRPFSSDIAVDDVMVSSESQVYNLSYCNVPTTSTTTSTPTTTMSTTPKPTTKTIHTTQRVTTIEQINTTAVPETIFMTIPWSCDFEDGTCGLSIIHDITRKEVTWNIGHHKAIYDKVSIDDGHVSPNHSGTNYLKFNSPFRWGSTFNGSSSVMTGYVNESVHLSFWYNMPFKFSNLNMFTRTLDGQESELWNRNASRDGVRFGWFQENITIIVTAPTKVIFKTDNFNYPTKVGLDDISLSSISTSHPNTSTQTPTVTPSPSSTSPSSLSPSSSPMTSSTTPQIPTTSQTPASPSVSPLVTESKLTDKKPSVSTTVAATKKPAEKPDKKSEDETPSNEQQRQNSSKNKVPASTVGGLVAGLVVVVIVGVVIYFVRERYYANRPDKSLEAVLSRHSKINGTNGVVNNGYNETKDRKVRPNAYHTHGKRFSSANVHRNKNVHVYQKYPDSSMRTETKQVEEEVESSTCSIEVEPVKTDM